MPRRRTRCIIPGYNWCGPGCSGPGAPVNRVDAACRAHDLCYRYGGNRCDCDVAFLRRLEPYIHLSTEEGRTARLIYTYMRFQAGITCSFRR
ncbi:phospholipase [Oceanobacillus piezotolerans]|uniref:Phospholipase n=1 Tax=Oceanobacillus piezotolerans TaxID=2448030 RepID=A0A498D8C4_9BACI|nr:phospholipase [Oceanobacillus piezotolerans]RLL44871.1 phospholipase [Oceanobacillus piezotolerans]